MKYPEYPDFVTLGNLIRDYASLKTELGAKDVQNILDQVTASLEQSIHALEVLEEDSEISSKEPDHLSAIKALRSVGPRCFERFMDL